MKVTSKHQFIPATKSAHEVDAVVVDLKKVAVRLEQTADNLAQLVAELREEEDGESNSGPKQDGS